MKNIPELDKILVGVKVIDKDGKVVDRIPIIDDEAIDLFIKKEEKIQTCTPTNCGTIINDGIEI
jgi:hypothetical protein